MASSGSSFIPQKPTRGKVAAKSFRKIYVLSYVSYLVFFSTLLAVGGVFAYKLSLESELDGLKEALVSQKNLFNQSDLDRIRSLDHRIDTAKLLVNNHASVVTVFNALERAVAQPVQLLSFDYSRLENQGAPTLNLTAVASEFDEVIFQETVFENNALTSQFDVSSVNLASQPVNPELLDLGVEQIVNLELTTELSVSDINYTGFSGTVLENNVPEFESITSESESSPTDDLQVDTVSREEVTLTGEGDDVGTGEDSTQPDDEGISNDGELNQ